MGEIFREILQVSLGMSIVIGVMIMILPFVRKRYDVKWCYFAWLMISIRLLLPFHIQWNETMGDFQKLQSAEIMVVKENGNTQTLNNLNQGESISISNKEIQQEKDKLQEESKIIDSAATERSTQESLLSGEKRVQSHLQRIWVLVKKDEIGYIWIVGMIIFLIYYGLIYYQFQRELKRWDTPINQEEKTLFETLKQELHISKEIQLLKSKKTLIPLIVGYVHPKVILPNKAYEAESLYFILKHELMHYQRKDLWYKLLVLLARMVHWFNPLVHLMARQVDQDIEAACDYRVMRNENKEKKKLYMQTILQMAEGQKRNYMSFTTAFNSEKRTLLYRFEAIVEGHTKKKGIIAILLVTLISVGCGGYIDDSKIDVEVVSSVKESIIENEVESSANNRENLKTEKMNTYILGSGLNGQEIREYIPESTEGYVVSIDGYSIEIPSEWKVELSENLGENDKRFTKSFLLYSNGKQIGEVRLLEGYERAKDEIFFEGHGKSELFDCWDEAYTKNAIDNPYTIQFDYLKDGELCYSEYEKINLNKSNAYYTYVLYLDRQNVSEDIAMDIVKSIKFPNYSKNAPPQKREALSLQEASKNAVYTIRYDTGLMLSYNEAVMERFKTSIKNHQEDCIEVVSYLGNRENLLIDEWSTLVTDGDNIYLYSYYEDSQNGKYKYMEEPLVFDYIVEKQDNRITSYRLGNDGEETTMRLIELRANYTPHMTILDGNEQEAYRAYRETKDEVLLKGISPITIAKYYIQAELDDDFETQYDLMVEYKPEDNMMGWTKEEHLKDAKDNKGIETKESIIKTFGNIGKGEFIQRGSDDGYILFDRYNENTGDYSEMGFQLEKNEEGIWKVCFMPIQ